jgi:3-methylcrotonyl-CoA carboxylase alpha subunit
MKANRLGPGLYRVTDGDRSELVYVAGGPDDRWAFWNGETYRLKADARRPAREPGSGQAEMVQSLTAPMPATVLKVLTTAGAHVRKGASLVILEAMKMELPVRAPADAEVAVVHCREGELVQADALLVELKGATG